MCGNSRRCLGVALAALVSLLAVGPALKATLAAEEAGSLRVGWATADITPDRPVPLVGFSYARVSEGVLDAITATALALESVATDGTGEMVVLVSCDLISIRDTLRDRVRELVGEALPELDAERIVLNATHTHAAPGVRTSPEVAAKLARHGIEVPGEWSSFGVVLDAEAMSPVEYLDFAAGRIAGAVIQAWEGREAGGVSFGLGHAAVGHNRLTTYYDGQSRMYGGTDQEDFSHIEGYEDHSVGLLFTYDAEGGLTGVVINVACPSQVSGGTRISADFWHETRNELRDRLGASLHVLPQCAAAGDQSPVVLVDRRAEERMQELTGRNRREQIAVRIADAVTSVLPYMEEQIEWNPAFAHRVEQVELSRRRLTEEDIRTPRSTHHRAEVETVEEAFERLREEYRAMLEALEANPEMREERGWFRDITGVYWRMARAARVLDRFEIQQTQPSMPVEVHVIRIGDVALATNPFELYLDYGVQIKARSRAVQTFVVQRAGGGSYVPTERCVAGGAYGATPESTPIGPEGGRELVERTLELIGSLWEDE